MVRNFTVALAVVFAGFVGLQALPASAQTVDIQGQIERLMAQIRDLTAQVNALRSQIGKQEPETRPEYPGVKHRICGLLARNLAQGTRGDDVVGLQEFLREQGFFSGNATGFFGPLTAQAVAKWQTSEGVSAAGSFGPMSRERLLKWCGGGGFVNKERFLASPTRGNAPLTVTFNTWLSGFRPQDFYYAIDYGDGTGGERAIDCPAPADACTGPGNNTHTYASNGTYTAMLKKYNNICPISGAPCLPTIPRPEIVSKIQIIVGPIACTKEYKPVCGAKPIVCVTTPCYPVPTTYGNRCEMNADGATLLYEGQCRGDMNPADDPQCKIWSDGCNTCSRQSPGDPGMCTMMACMVTEGYVPKPYCKEYFGASGNKPPIISGFSGPTTLAVNTNGTWSLSASDPENGTLTYRINWGDQEAPRANFPTTAAAEQPFVQSTTFTHAYANPGTYTITIIARDDSGQSAEMRTTVRVNSNIVCTTEYVPVCGRPSGCANTCPSGQFCTLECQLTQPQTFSNRCALDVAGATFLYGGQC